VWRRARAMLTVVERERGAEESLGAWRGDGSIQMMWWL